MAPRAACRVLQLLRAEAVGPVAPEDDESQGGLPSHRSQPRPHAGQGARAPPQAAPELGNLGSAK